MKYHSHCGVLVTLAVRIEESIKAALGGQEEVGVAARVQRMYKILKEKP